VASFGERPAQSEGLTRVIHPVCASPPTGELQRHRASVGVDFRALIRRGVRSRSRVLPLDQADALLTFPPSEVCQLDRWAFALPSSASGEGLVAFRRSLPSSRRSRVSIRPSLEVTPKSPSNPLRVFHLPPNRVTFALGDEPRTIRADLAFAKPVRSVLVVPLCRPPAVKPMAQPS
jgi:hypothetical protein